MCVCDAVIIYRSARSTGVDRSCSGDWHGGGRGVPLGRCRVEYNACGGGKVGGSQAAAGDGAGLGVRVRGSRRAGLGWAEKGA